MLVFKRIILFILLVLISCKKPTLEEFYKELCFEKMDDDYLQQIERMPDIQMGWGHLLWEGNAYSVTKRDTKKVHLLKEGDIIFRIDDCLLGNLFIFLSRFDYKFRNEDPHYFNKMDILIYYSEFAKPKNPKEHKIWIYRNHDISVIYAKKIGRAHV